MRRPLAHMITATALAAAAIIPISTTATAAPTSTTAPAHTATTTTTADARVAAVPDAFTDDGVRIRNGPGTNHPVNGLGYRSHSVTKHCFVGYDVQWTYITDNTTGVSGYVPPRYLGNGNFDIGMC